MSAFIVLAVSLLVLLLLAGLRRVPDGSVCTVHRFGRFVRALGPGVHLTWPLVDQIAHRINLIGHHIELAHAEGRCAAVVYFQILEPQRAGAIIEQIDATVEQAARRRLNQLSSQPADVGLPLANRLKHDLNSQLGTLGLHVTRCQLRTA